MSITESHPNILYAMVLAAYVPGLVAIFRSPRLAAMPLLTFTFLGMFLFTALGSWQVMTRTHYLPFETPGGELTTVPAGTLGSGAFVTMLILQAALFYLVAGVYLYLRKGSLTFRSTVVPADLIMRRALLVATMVILTMYYLKVGRFILFDLLAGRINRVNILEFRALTYGLKEYPFFRLGFLVLPALMAALSVGIASARGRMGKSDFAWIGICLVPPMLLAEKSAILNMGAVLFIAYSVHLGMHGRALGSALNGKTMLAIAAAFVPTLITYFIYFNTPGDSGREIMGQLMFRVVGVYSEALAATVGFVDKYGFLNGTTVPNLKGMLPHERYNLEAAMQLFLSGRDINQLNALVGSTPVPATGEGYVNFGWFGFILFGLASFSCVVLFQEILLRLRLAATSFALSGWYGYLAFTLFTTSLFATFISLVHTAIAAALVAMWFAMHRLQVPKAA